MVKEFVMVQFDQISDKTTILKSKMDEHEIKINTLLRNQEFLRN